MNRFEWTNATTVEEAIAQANEKSVVKAGGVDLLDRLKEGLEAPARLVNIRNIKKLEYVEYDAAKGLRLGPLVTLAEIDANPKVRASYRVLADAAGQAATPQIRNMATVGGNLLQRPRCWYFRSEHFHCRRKGGEECFAQAGENQYHAIFDNEICAIVHPSAAATALTALGATLEITGPNGKREAPIEGFFVSPKTDVTREHPLAPNEILTEIRVPALPATARQAYWKQGEKESFDWPIAEVAVVLDMDGDKVRKASVVLGAAAPTPWRAKGAEAALVGKPVTEETARAAAKAAVDGASPLGENAYKTAVFEVVVRRTILAAAKG